MQNKLKKMEGEEFVRKVLDGERNFKNISLEEGFDLSGYEGFSEMNDYLKKQNLKDSPLDITNSEFKFVKASGLYLPFVKGRKANLEDANLWYANLWNANLGYANLWKANLWNANLGYANLWKANLEDANLENANLENANLGYANLRKANLWKANLRKANLWNANLWYANLENANLWYANLWYANLENANLENANLENANLWYANLENANLEKANLKGVRNLKRALNLGLAHFLNTKVGEAEKAIIEEALRGRTLFIVV